MSFVLLTVRRFEFDGGRRGAIRSIIARLYFKVVYSLGLEFAQYVLLCELTRVRVDVFMFPFGALSVFKCELVHV